MTHGEATGESVNAAGGQGKAGTSAIQLLQLSTVVTPAAGDKPVKECHIRFAGQESVSCRQVSALMKINKLE